MNLSPPASDELELSVFGRGYGEAICLHAGNGEWFVIDSCVNPETREPASISHLQSYGLVPSEVVRLVIATHWDDDHIHGLADIVEQCPNARFSCSAALGRKDIWAFVIEKEAATGALGSGLDELRRILRICVNRGSAITWAKANLPLYPMPPGDAPQVIALSPSENAVERSIEALIETATSTRTLDRRYKAPEGPNGASVATSIRCLGTTMLLCADLETSANPEAGWDAVLTYSKPAVTASIVKVPHHGSPTAHHDSFWSDLVDRDPVAVVSPWARGKHFLPTAEDLTRLRSFSNKLYVTSLPSQTRARHDPEVEKLVRRLHGNRISQLRGWGHVRARMRAGEQDWRVETFGDARLDST